MMSFGRHPICFNKMKWSSGRINFRTAFNYNMLDHHTFKCLNSCVAQPKIQIEFKIGRMLLLWIMNPKLASESCMWPKKKICKFGELFFGKMFVQLIIIYYSNQKVQRNEKCKLNFQRLKFFECETDVDYYYSDWNATEKLNLQKFEQMLYIFIWKQIFQFHHPKAMPYN